MENASKALIIAGAILLSILIIALGIYVFNMAKGATNTDALNDLELSQFNSLFTNYDGSCIGSNLSSLLDKMITNTQTNKDADDRLPDLVYIETRTSGGLNHTGVGLSAANNTVFTSDQLSASGITGDVTFTIVSNSGNTNKSALSTFRSKIAQKHYYQVGHIIDDNTGTVSAMVIKY